MRSKEFGVALEIHLGINSPAHRQAVPPPWSVRSGPPAIRQGVPALGTEQFHWTITFPDCGQIFFV